MPRTPLVALALLTLAACTGRESAPAEEPAPEASAPEPVEAPVEAPPSTSTAPTPGIERGPGGATLELLEGDALRALLAESAGKPRVYNFWATWCGPCVAELPMLRDLAASRDDFELVLVNVDLGPMRRMRALPFIEQKDLTALRHVAVESRDPARTLAEVIEGWDQSIPVTSVHRADGTRSALFTRAISSTELAAALDAAR